jgi:hypothetical protein
MQRVGVIDGLRGYFLVLMFLTHLGIAGSFNHHPLQLVNHAQLSFVRDAPGFFFLSGLLVGMVYGRRMTRHGFADAASRLWRRAAKLYIYTIVCLVAILVLRAILPGAPQLWSDMLGPFGNGSVSFVVAVVLLLYQVHFIDILPQFIVYLIAAPPLLWLSLTGRWPWVVVGSALLWLAVQIGGHLPLAEAINNGLSDFEPELRIRAAFNVLAWQLPFFGAMVIGALLVQGKIELQRIFHPEKTLLVRAFAASLLFFLAFRQGLNLGIVPRVIASCFYAYTDLSEFGLVLLLNFVSLSYVTAWLLIAGPRSKQRLTVMIGRALTFLFELSFLRLLGRHSLQVYAWHVVLIYVLFWLDWSVGHFGKLGQTVMALCGIGLLALPAIFREWPVRPAYAREQG